MRFLALCLLVLVLGCREPGNDVPLNPPPTPDPVDPSPEPDDPVLVQLLSLHNTERARSGRGKLKLVSELNLAAQGHANWMAASRRLSHTGRGGSSFSDRLREAGAAFSAGGENIAMGYNNPQAVMAGWMGSSGHRANILNSRYDSMGAGVATSSDNRRYWCVVFTQAARPFSAEASVVVELSEPGGLEASDDEDTD